MLKEVTLGNTEAWTYHSKEMDDEYEIRVALPKSPPPEEGYPIIYVLDGQSYFQFARDVIRLQSKNSAKTFVHEAIVVGIGHAGEDEDIRKRRFYDFTAPAKEYIYPERLKGFDVGKHGGAKKFLHFIEEELKPRIEKRYIINKKKQALFGHSLSGLFTLWTLFTKPAAFQTYLACSPSIWWNDYELFKYMEAFLQQKIEKIRIHITVGEYERFMVDDAKRMAHELITKIPEAVLECEYYIAPEENHASVVPTIMSRAIRFACRS
ncbi:alpha/beta hydrolase-fold protein [Bacillus sp. FJAT-50079]|uniref:alpha/beta hydrolase n=1 Tax=Bacillus sp. FJAT-50079 TaxID=2833577 RepID=UPI001BC95C11|nr:alpha/beta hydrolase-fold protein [Bacillus sp. FJAT-50079]MBS4210107.1 alpha/beta hydrolase [Bacillus sp. FJAT-50079]